MVFFQYTRSEILFYGLNALAEWTCDYKSSGIIDRGRTAWGRINGHCTLTIGIDGLTAKYT